MTADKERHCCSRTSRTVRRSLSRSYNLNTVCLSLSFRHSFQKRVTLAKFYVYNRRLPTVQSVEKPIFFENGVAGAKPPHRSSAICATASCSGFVRLTASILAWTRGGSPTLSPGTDAGRVCPKALHDAEPTKHTQPFTTGKGFGVSARMPR